MNMQQIVSHLESNGFKVRATYNPVLCTDIVKVWRQGNTQMIAFFNLSKGCIGLYDLYIRNPDTLDVFFKDEHLAVRGNQVIDIIKGGGYDQTTV